MGTAHMWHQQVSWGPGGRQAVRTSATVSPHAAGQAALHVLCTRTHKLACSWRKAVGNNRATWCHQCRALTARHVVCLLLQLLGAPLELPSRRTLWRSGCWTVTGQGPSATLWQVGVLLFLCYISQHVGAPNVSPYQANRPTAPSATLWGCTCRGCLQHHSAAHDDRLACVKRCVCSLEPQADAASTPHPPAAHLQAWTGSHRMPSSQQLCLCPWGCQQAPGQSQWRTPFST